MEQRQYTSPEAYQEYLRPLHIKQEFDEREIIVESSLAIQPETLPIHSIFRTGDIQENVLIDFGVQKQQRKLQNELSQIESLQQQWDMTLGIRRADESNLIRSYNPVLARWKFEQCESAEELEKFTRYEIAQQITNLRERYYASTSRYHYMIDADGKLRNEYFPDEPFEESMKRGIEWRKQNGSQEQEREEQEMVGFQKIQDLADAPVGTTAISLSGPGVVQTEWYKTGYPKNFVDLFKVIQDENGGKKIQTTRYESVLSYEEYRTIAEQLNPGYFDNEQGPIDAWFLAHPIIKNPGELPDTADEIFEAFFDKPEDSLKEEEMQEIIECCMPYVLYLMKVLTASEFNPEKIALAFNTVLIKGDKAHANVMRKREGKSILETHDIFKYDIEKEVNIVGRQRVEKRAAGCGDSAGFAMGAEQMLVNSVAKFGINTGEKIEDQFGSLVFECPEKYCRKKNVRPYGQLISRCQHCGSEAVSCKPGEEKPDTRAVSSWENKKEEEKK